MRTLFDWQVRYLDIYLFRVHGVRGVVCIQRVNYASTSCLRRCSTSTSRVAAPAIWPTRRRPSTRRSTGTCRIRSTRNRGSSSPTSSAARCSPSSRRLGDPTRTCRRPSPTSSDSRCAPNPTLCVVIEIKLYIMCRECAENELQRQWIAVIILILFS